MTKMQSVRPMKSAVLGGRKRCTPVCLFGAPDPLELEKAYEEAVMEMQDNFARRWRLDVLTMQPSAHTDARLLWEEVRDEKAEDRLAAEVVAVTGPEGRRRIPHADAEVNTVAPVGSRRGEPVRYSPYQKQQKVSDYWRTTKSPCQVLQTKSPPKKSEDGHTFFCSEVTNISLK